jgi:putative hydrolase of the HAD superfamily
MPAMNTPRIIGLDADDTLWHNETFYRASHERFVSLLAPWAGPDEVESAFHDVEERNLLLYGYGAKGHTLSMLETALELGGSRLPATTLADIFDVGRDLMRHPVQTFDGVPQALERLRTIAPLVLITKGDLLHQETKLAASGLGSLFSGVEIVSDKNVDTYRRAFMRHGVPPEDALMAGNSVRSDILPALEAGCLAVLIPYPIVWAHEAAVEPEGHPRYRRCDTLTAMADWLVDA